MGVDATVFVGIGNGVFVAMRVGVFVGITVLVGIAVFVGMSVFAAMIVLVLIPLTDGFLPQSTIAFMQFVTSFCKTAGSQALKKS